MQKETAIKHKQHKPRNDTFFDIWSITHFVTGIGFGWLMNPFIALIIMVLWEPVEIFVLSPILAKLGFTFGYETLRNSLSDIVLMLRASSWEHGY